jgi:hypothetical protein
VQIDCLNKGRSNASGRAAKLLLLAGLSFVLAGCASTSSPGINSHAAVTIRGHAVTDVVLTTRAVFEEHDFVLARAEPDRMIFERPGTKAEQVKYGSFASSRVTIRAKVDLQEMGPDTFFLRCDVFSVRDAGESVLEDETRLILVSSKPYRRILNEVRDRLEPSAPPAP